MMTAGLYIRCMRYVALLRGVNVGGANKVSMADLKAIFEAAGMTAVKTYINSGNVIFSTDIANRAQLTGLLRKAVRRRAGLDVDLQLRDADDLSAVVEAMPVEWTNDGSMKCDVVFLQPDVDQPSILEELGPRPGVEDALYVPGAVIWRVNRENATRSRLTRIVGTPLYSRVTVRNCNTTRKLLELLVGPTGQTASSSVSSRRP
jgi:uncharacterized protein (DUF1697 family)